VPENRTVGRFASIWMALQPRQRLIAVLGLLALVATIFGLVQATRSPPMETLYAGLDQAAADEVAAAVQGMGVPVELRGGAVLVTAGERERVRMALAAAGLPRNGPEGYELLEDLDGFGTTSEMFNATYWRAKEGELARTILAAPGVRSARVHIANPAGRPFQRSARPTASVTVTMGGGVLDTAQAEAMRYLVASAVAGLEPDMVSVIDAAHGTVLRLGESVSGMGGQLPGSAREAQLRSEIERLLAARVGDGKAIVTVAVETTAESETTVERLIDPNSRIAISTDTREVEDQGTGGAGGAATVASNLPVEGGGPGGGGSTRSRTETEERINYEVSQTTRERVRRAGEVSRVTVAVLVDGITAIAPNGERQWAPRPESELQQLRDLVRSAIGYDEERGDVVTVETLEFAERPQGGTVATSGLTNFLSRNALPMAQIGALAAVALGLAFFVLRPLLKAAEAQAVIVPERLPPSLEFGEAEDYTAHQSDLDPLTMLRNAFAEQRDDSANVLRSWLERDVQERMADEAEDEEQEA
jgi:flagellar M-ring protein FliF